VSQPPAEIPSPPEAARVLAEIAVLLELHSADRFRSRAFAAAARALEGTSGDLAALARAGDLATLPGIGPGIASVLSELMSTGRSGLHEELVEATPVGLFDLMRLPGLGTKRIRLLHEQLGIDSLDSLEEAARQGRIAVLSGFGRKTQEKLLEGIAFARGVRGRRLYPRAVEAAERLAEGLRRRPEVVEVAVAGAVRRCLEVVDRVDIVVASTAPEETGAEFAALNGVSGASVDEEGVLVGSLTDGLPVRLRCATPEGFAAALLWETGSAEHLAELAARAGECAMSLDRDGVRKGRKRIDVADEAALYSVLGLQYLPPELREGLGEVALAHVGAVPMLVEAGDLRGTFHCHTTASDGKSTLREMAEGAQARGWDYLGIADHSRTAAYAGGLPPDALLAQCDEVARINDAEEVPGLRLFAGTESDILADGSLDYPDELLARLDYVVGSVHSAFRMTREAMTERIVRAVRNPRLTILGHPTGRLLLRREGYAVDLDAVLEAAAASGVVVEINAHPNRLDLDWREVRKAAARGIIIAINPDAHSADALDHVAYGVNIARKAGLEPRQILNCWSRTEVEAYFAERKQAG
jgi:DNA polymerase (family X)